MFFISRKDAILRYGSVDNFLNDLINKGAGCTFRFSKQQDGIEYSYDVDTTCGFSNAGFVEVNGIHAFEFITNKIGVPAALEQLAEEADELSHAALKLARVLRGENPTPVSKDKAYDNFIEELGDIRLCVDVLKFTYGPMDTDDVETKKQIRWIDRILQKEATAAAVTDAQ